MLFTNTGKLFIKKSNIGTTKMFMNFEWTRVRENIEVKRDFILSVSTYFKFTEMANYKDNFIKTTFFWSMVEKTEIEMVSPTIFILWIWKYIKGDYIDIFATSWI